jgi:hypothetical protein
VQSQSPDRSQRAPPWAGRYMAPAAAAYEHLSSRLRKERQEKRVGRPSAAWCAHSSNPHVPATEGPQNPRAAAVPKSHHAALRPVAGAGVLGGAVPARRRPAAASRRRGGAPNEVLLPPSPARSEGRAATAAARRRRRCWRPWRVGWRPRGPCGSASRWAPSWSSQAGLVAAATNRPPY